MTAPAVENLPSERRRVIAGMIIGSAGHHRRRAARARGSSPVVAGWVGGATVVLLWTWIPILALDSKATEALSIR